MLFARSFVFAILFYANLTAWLLMCLPLLALPSRHMFPVARAWARSNLWLLRHVTGTKVEWRGLENIPAGGVLVAAKHQSAWETFALLTVFERPVFVLKQELVRLPVFGWFLRHIGMIPVNRSAGASALAGMARMAREKVREGHQVIIFPEGTRRPPGAPPDYRTGVAFLYDSLKAPCVPVALNSGLFWPRRSFIRRPGTVVVSILPPLPPGIPRRQVIAELERRIEAETGRLLENADVAGADIRREA
ncbi:MAG: lysophospholipid acyltransferase family protein [Pseudochelatococcus sp.]|jgi:1-acyl-sn-glycerol-3-phosphate acyltransferase|uniref:lysophospholipid acyltransferase family protein n=1 Tax=Pseudochelatococcus sp. TaxID=2020869 RepID=UPI003D90564B